jgi:glyoxylase-like metal-dependent hydrolase (beta-lactamase superfamily II)
MALWVACAAASAFADEGPVPASPAAKTFKLGALEISVLRDSVLTIPNDGSVFGLNEKSPAVAKVLSEAGAPPEKIRLDVDALLIRMPSHLVLIDTGFGPAAHGALRESLASAGLSPDAITDIFITHSHSDHVGGLVDAQGRAAFPKATVRMSSAEWAYMQKDADSRATAIAIKAQVQAFEPGKSILPGITPIALFGHTPGHCGYEISSQGHTLLDTGDLVHSSIISLARPDWTIAWDSDKQEGAKARHHELQHLADTHELMFAPHFPFPGVGRIEKAGDGFKFLPGVPAGHAN